MSQAANHAFWLFVVGCAGTVVAEIVPGARGTPRWAIWQAIGALLIAALAALLPWKRWPARASLLLLIPAFLMIGSSQIALLVPPRTYGMFFVISFVWVGVHHKPGTAFWLAPITAVAYVIPLEVSGAPPAPDWRSVLFLVGACLFVAETIARRNQQTDHERTRAERAARSFETVGHYMAGVRQQNSEAVLDSMVDAVVALGYESANIGIIDPDDDTFEAIHTRGMASAFAGQRYNASEGLTGQVRDANAAVVVDDYQSAERTIGRIRASRIRTAIGLPVHCDGALVAVLVAATEQRRAVYPEDVEALRILADSAGSALSAATEFAAERDLAAANEEASLTDALTGLSNRRRAEQCLGALAAGDAVVLIDVDHFKRVNDELGHATGDRVLIELAGNLTAHVRAVDMVTRFGGEEFLLILPQTPPKLAEMVVGRLMEAWRSTRPLTTFSAGIALHPSGGKLADTVKQADEALYEAKRQGRDRLCLAGAMPARN
jgi:diguanylate cyclase (GGDEF)-like protein